MSSSRRRTVRFSAGACLLALGALAQGCSSSRTGENGDGSWRLSGSGARPAESREAAAEPRGFDSDGPSASPRNTYRGGRDPVSGRATDRWPPAAPPTESASVSQLPPQPAPFPASAPTLAGPAPYRGPDPGYAQSLPPPQVAGRGAASDPVGRSVEVRTGDTLYRIARAHNVSVEHLKQANGLSSESIKVGQQLTIPAR
jgi:hypothetical protein